jgi:4-hydroxy-L-threonine phosphate dehydrogenase PdxA
MNMATTQSPRIAIASGDLAGIGPQISLKAALDKQVRRMCRPLVVGDPMVLELTPAPPESKHRFMSSPRRRPPIGRATPSTFWPSRCRGERR